MKKLINTSIILIALILLSFGTYLYFWNNPTSEADDSSPISSSLDSSPVAAMSASDNQIAQDTAFLATLTSLTVIKIDTSLFTDTAFNSLRDNAVTIAQIAPGRPNPFASISSNPASTVTASSVTTGEATTITSTSAVLNATTSTNATTSYFQYGVGTALNKTTAPAIVSLVGVFNTKLTSLTSKTQYSFRAASKIGGTVIYGDTLTFTTN